MRRSTWEARNSRLHRVRSRAEVRNEPRIAPKSVPTTPTKGPLHQDAVSTTAVEVMPDLPGQSGRRWRRGGARPVDEQRGGLGRLLALGQLARCRALVLRPRMAP